MKFLLILLGALIWGVVGSYVLDPAHPDTSACVEGDAANVVGCTHADGTYTAFP